MSREKIIRDALTSFIQSYIPDADLSSMDEVFVSYVTGVLEELGTQETSEDDFDMETFLEMLEGYIPGFAEIGSDNVFEMMFELSGQLSEARNKENDSLKPSSETSDVVPESDGTVPRQNKLQAPPEGAEAQGKDELQKNIDVLLEMFPCCSLRQAEKVLSMAKGNLEDAVHIIVDSEGQLNNASEPQELQKAPKKEDLKDFILDKYMLVDDEEDKKTHRPLMPKEAPKKMIRYIDNQVVSTKGERYKDMKKPESEEMKKTYINLKPAKKYKFH
ncbi:PREDICTED: CUE domain-containing protein 2 isoform X1 [Nanorana parkeri]|uniref:CUE domain-containing protein 2 isoform X1 n=1 Tax=Nanorana parkeri TaxID=125878 RepID=UPI0008548F4A|nr:PREDICTED: CUE domain-containing protein 2 isoform X1 [Nanorana parkeri]